MRPLSPVGKSGTSAPQNVPLLVQRPAGLSLVPAVVPESPQVSPLAMVPESPPVSALAWVPLLTPELQPPLLKWVPPRSWPLARRTLLLPTPPQLALPLVRVRLQAGLEPPPPQLQLLAPMARRARLPPHGPTLTRLRLLVWVPVQMLVLQKSPALGPLVWQRGPAQE